MYVDMYGWSFIIHMYDRKISIVGTVAVCMIDRRAVAVFMMDTHVVGL